MGIALPPRRSGCAPPARRSRFLLVPSAIGFDSLAGHATLPIPPGAEEPELKGRVWDDLWRVTSGAWCEGWVTPYWSGKPLPDAQWEVQVEAADRAARNDQVFIACAAYHNDEELEYVLASLLMAYHAQGRLCIQPMPLRPNQPPDAGYSLDVFRKEITDKANYFNMPIGVGFSGAPCPARGGRRRVAADVSGRGRLCQFRRYAYENPAFQRPDAPIER